MKKLFNENMLRFATNGEKNLVLKEEKHKKPDGDGDGVPPWADKDDDDPEVSESVFHACASHVRENKSGAAGRCINHTLLENGTVTHYTVEFKNVVVENIPVGSLTVLKEAGHLHKRDREDYELEESGKPRVAYLEEEDKEEKTKKDVKAKTIAGALDDDDPGQSDAAKAFDKAVQNVKEETELEEQSARDRMRSRASGMDDELKLPSPAPADKMPSRKLPPMKPSDKMPSRKLPSGMKPGEGAVPMPSLNKGERVISDQPGLKTTERDVDVSPMTGKKVKGKVTTTVQGSEFTDKEKALEKDLMGDMPDMGRRRRLREAIKKALNGIKQRASK